MMRLLKTWAVIMGVMLTIYLIYIGYACSLLSEIDDISADPYQDVLMRPEPLSSNKYIDALQFPSLLEKSRTLMSIYNKRVQMGNVVRERLQVLKSLGKVGHAVEKTVEFNLDKIAKDNERIKRHFDLIVEFAEKQYAASLMKTYAPDIEEKARLFDKSNDVLLRSIDIPISFK